MKQTIKLNEAQLRKVVTETVKKVLMVSYGGFVLVERESNAPEYEHKDRFNDLKTAQDVMKQRYREIAVDNVDAVEKASIDNRSANVYLNDGNIIEWDIEDENEF